MCCFGESAVAVCRHLLQTTLCNSLCVVLLDCLLDISFVVDSSGSIRMANQGGVDNWQVILDFMVDVVESINVGQDQTRVGSVTFSM